MKVPTALGRFTHGKYTLVPSYRRPSGPDRPSLRFGKNKTKEKSFASARNRNPNRWSFSS